MCSFKIFKSKEFLNNNVQIFIFIYLFTNCLQIFIYFAAIDDKPSSSSEEQTAPIAPGGYQNPAYSRSASFERSPEKHGRRRITPQQVPHQFEVERVNGKLEAMLMGMPADGKI